MTKIFTEYKGHGQTELTHEPTGEKITTDLPPDNGGNGTKFSPTDLLASALSSCILTIMAKMAKRDGVDFEGAEITIDKEMADNPRRVGKFIMNIKYPAHLTEEQKKKYAAAINGCPVHKSLHPDIKTEISIIG